MSYPKISIVTPSFNQGRYLEETIQSVLSQNYPNLEFLILDGGSTDDSVEIIRRYEDKLDFWRSHKDAGQSAAIIEGFERATGDIIAWLNSDDRYEPGTLHTIADAFRRNQQAVLIYGDYYIVRQDGTRVLKRKVSCDFNVMAYAYLMIPQPSAFWKRSAYNELGGLDPELHYVMDYDLFLRFARTYPADAILHIRKALSAFRLHPESKSVSHMPAFVRENRLVVDRLVPPRGPLQRYLLRFFYLLKVEWMYLAQRGFIPLRKDRSKA